jgi:prevent-host-death family protein
MARATQTKAAEEARQGLPAILTAAARGTTTVITRRGEPLAAVVPIDELRKSKAVSLVPLFGSGKRLWGRESTKTVEEMRDEWTR